MSPALQHGDFLWKRQSDDNTLYEDRGDFALSRSIAMLVLATICVALRFLCRKIRSAKFAIDDWVLLAALVVVYCVGAANIAEVVNGLGQRSSTLTFETRARFEYSSPDVMEWFYVTSVTTTKFALLLLYLRVFSISHKFRIAVYVVATSILLWAVALYVVLALQCDPIHAAWQPDIIILSLPLTQITRLQASHAQRLSLCITFLLGGFVLIASAVRLYVLITQMDLNDPTWSFLEPCTWCVIELTSGVISVCLPTFWPLLMHISACYSKYVSSRSSSKLASNGEPGHEIITIGGGKASWGRNVSGDKSSDVLGLTAEVALDKRSITESHGDESEHAPWRHSVSEFRV